MPRTARQGQQHGEAQAAARVDRPPNRVAQGQRRPAGGGALKLVTPPTLAVLLAAIVAIAVLSQNLFFSSANLNSSILDSSATSTIQTFPVSSEDPTPEIKMSSTEQT